ncbi:hypothetical protein QUB56_34765 [Microcoleus sp. AR_TQ3_B6]|uniref:hypothetical protein n=1 Tax=Microcoleus sp. AR_TQ3_B6 TaxID=3055284 RepID=UPI002FD09F84
MRCPKRHYLRESLDNFSSQNQTPRSSFFKAGDRFLSTNYPLTTAMINIKITAPVFKKNEFQYLEPKADIQIAGDFESLSEGYTFLRTQIDELLQKQQAENTLLLNHDRLQKEIDNKEKTLLRINRSIEVARRQFQRLQNFLERLGINPDAFSLTIADKPIEVSTSSSVNAEVVDPIPFDLLNRDSTDEDEF